MIEKDGAIMITGGSSSGVAVAVQALCQEAGVIFMAGLTHANDTTGKDKRPTASATSSTPTCRAPRSRRCWPMPMAPTARPIT
jgi:signal recognition particle receptor subunit beta